MRKKRNYINNKDFYDALVKYYDRCDKAKAENREEPVIPDYIGECFMHIAKNLARKFNFSGYTFKEEMIGDGIENAIIAAKKFDVNKGQNPFAYFTQIIWFAYLRRIEKEAKQSYIKHMSLVNASMDMMAAGGYENINIDDDKAQKYVEKFQKKKEPLKPMKPKGLEKFVE